MKPSDYEVEAIPGYSSPAELEHHDQAMRSQHPGRMELAAFITAARRQLHALSESLEQASNARPADAGSSIVSIGDDGEAPSDARAATSEPTDPPNEPAAPSIDTAAQPVPAAASPAASGLLGEPVCSQAGDADPLARLNAIKQRLAKQLENTQ